MSNKNVLENLKLFHRRYATYRKKYSKRKETFINDRIMYEYYSGMLLANKYAIQNILLFGGEYHIY